MGEEEEGGAKRRWRGKKCADVSEKWRGVKRGGGVDGGKRGVERKGKERESGGE